MNADAGAQRDEPKQSLYADRVRVYPKSVTGPVRRIKWAVLVGCLGIYYLLPWVRWSRGPGEPSQAVLLDLARERFYFFGFEFWPQDITLLTGALIVGAIGLFLVTSLFGRVWCGFACPQTVWTDLFLLVERRIEGDRAERMHRDRGPRSVDYWRRKLAKHLIWLGIAFWTGGAWILYYVNAPTAVREFWTGTASSAVYGFIALFTATTYLLAGWAREQVCTFMCPWPRFQSAMLDEQSLIVTYEAWRGEPRCRGVKRMAADGEKRAGDCIDCGACVDVCPMGVDIRNGLQLPCIHCGLCVDACDTIMDRIGRERRLITWDTLAGQVTRSAGGSERWSLLRSRTFIYGGVLTLALALMLAGLVTRARVTLEVEHDRAPLFVRLPDGSIRNGYQIRVVNKLHEPADFALTVHGPAAGPIRLAEGATPPAGQLSLPVGPDSVATFRVLMTGPASRQGQAVFALALPGTGIRTEGAARFISATEPGVSP